MSNAIEVRGLGKQYQLGTLSHAGDFFFDQFLRRIAHFLRQKSYRRAEKQYFWALKDISFDVKPGEVVGVIGRNGAGKSTLLKVLARITHLTTGHVNLYGRTGALLEVGVGFHPELTGEENIYLNGMILGMTRAEIKAQFDEIVAFAEVQDFISTPVKRYSSGMYVRLAFAVAAHLSPEILIVDEVLAVGDMAFQQKSLGKMGDMVNQGRTVLFVSHNMASIRSICQRVIVLHKGQIVFDGDTDQGIATYMQVGGLLEQDGYIPDDAYRVQYSDEVVLKRVNVTDLAGHDIRDVRIGQPFQIRITYDVLKPIHDFVLELGLSSNEGIRIATIFSNERDHAPFQLNVGTHEICATITDIEFLPREFVIDVACHHHDNPKGIKTIEWVDATMRLKVVEAGYEDVYGYEWPSTSFSYLRGYVRPQVGWIVDDSVVKPKFSNT